MPLVAPTKGLVAVRRSRGIRSFSKVSMEMTLRPVPPSMRVLETATPLIVGVQMRGRAPTMLVDLGWSPMSKSILCWDHSRALGALLLVLDAIT